MYVFVIDYIPCTSNPCEHDAWCVNNKKGYKCNCYGNYEGTTCSGRY